MSRPSSSSGRAIPGGSIAAAAEAEGADLVVVGTRGRSGAGRMFLGSVSDHVVRHAGCPVLVVRPSTRHVDRCLAGPIGEGLAPLGAAGRARLMLVASLASTTVLAAWPCSSAVARTRAASRVARPTGPTLDVVLDSTQHWVGTNDVLLSVYDPSGGSLAERAAAAASS